MSTKSPRNTRGLALLASLMALAPGATFAQVRLSESTGVNLFRNNCTSCHGNPPVENAPTEAVIKQMPRADLRRDHHGRHEEHGGRN